MDNTMREALGNIVTTAPQRQHRTRQGSSVRANPPLSTTAQRTPEDVLRDLRENKVKEANAKAAAEETEESRARHDMVIESVAELIYADQDLTVRAAELDRKRKSYARGSVQDGEIAKNIDQVADDRKIVSAALGKIKAENLLAYEDGQQRYNVRQAALAAEEKIRQHGEVKAADIEQFVSSAVLSGFIVVPTAEDKPCEASFTFRHQSYQSAWPYDPSVSEVAFSLKKMIADFHQHMEDREDTIVGELRHGGFYLSTQRLPRNPNKPDGDKLDSEFDLFKRENRKRIVRLSTLLGRTNDSDISIVPLGRPRSFVVIERRDGKIVASKTTDYRFGNFLFYRRNNQDQRVVKTEPVNLYITGADLSEMKIDELRQAMEHQVRTETENITFEELRSGRKGTCSVSVHWKVRDEQGVTVKIPIRFNLTGDGAGTFVRTGNTPEHLIKRVDPKGYWLAKTGQPQKLDVLNSLPVWGALSGENKQHERDWQLSNEAEVQNAVRVSKENLDELIGLDSRDGLYSVSAVLRKTVGGGKGKPNYHYNPVGYLIARRGSKVEIVWAVPGTSANFASQLTGEQEISDLPNRFRRILDGVRYGVTRTNERPKHLDFVKQQDATNETDEE